MADPDKALRAPELPRIAHAHLRIVQKSLEPGLWDSALRLGQRTFGCNWIEICTRNIRDVYGRERLGTLTRDKSYIVVSNHRSFFDMYVITAYLVKRGLSHRILFPVRSNFFYDSAAGIFVNGVMSFFAMYPPVFRERALAHLNVASLDETIRLLRMRRRSSSGFTRKARATRATRTRSCPRAAASVESSTKRTCL